MFERTPAAVFRSGSRLPSLLTSLVVHAALFVYAVFSPAGPSPRPYSVYREQIFPNRKKIIWYSFKTRLPEVSPLERRGPSSPPRVRVRIPDQTVVSQAPKAPRASQMIWLPAPRLRLKQEIRSPNLLAFEVPQIAPPPARPAPKRFAPPPEPRRAPAPLPALPQAPELTVRAVPAPALIPRTEVAIARPAPKRFVPPPERPRPAQSGPETGGASVTIEAAPQLAAPAPGAGLTAAIVGLRPVPNPGLAIPEGAREAQFSGGPELNPKAGGGAEPVPSARIFVPGLMVRGGNPGPPGGPAQPALIARAAPTSAESLRAAMRSAIPAPQASHPSATRVASAPDPRFEGRAVYSLAIQMPNVTSYIGSWIIWFAERGGMPGDASAIEPPVPLRKVDPKYIPSAVADGIEGKVQLTAVIRRDGRVDAVTLLKSLDERLDRSAEEAMRKWEFLPALRGGIPVDVDAVVEIPFRLAPKTGK